MATETLTVRMSRSDPSIIWGFRLQGGRDVNNPLTISKIVEGSLAERAGLLEDDHVVVICGRNADQMFHRDAQNAILESGNDLEMVIERTGSKIWKPTISTTGDHFSPVKYSLAHHEEVLEDQLKTTPISTHRMPADSTTYPRPNTISYGGPTTRMPTTKTVDSYLRETGGLFGTDANLVKQQQQQGNFLHSETLRLIRESETGAGRGTDRHESVQPTDENAQFQSRGAPFEAQQRVQGGPVCDTCGRPIHGVFCKAQDKCYHGDCFKCSTCGTSLKNVGHYLIQEKLYCDIHARQQQQNHFRATGPRDPSIFSFRGAPPQMSPKHSEPPKAFYQPEVLKPTHSPLPHVHSAPLSPQSRGIPTHVVSKMPGSALRQAHEDLDLYRPPQPPPLMPTGQPPQNYSSQQPLNTSSAFSRTVDSYVPRRGQGVLKQLGELPRVPVCESCQREIRGPFVLAMSKTWCPDHFTCAHPDCRRKLLDVGFIEEDGFIYCEFCFEKYLAPTCNKCLRPIVGDTLTALEKKWHPQCFCCTHCHMPFGNSCFFLEEGKPFCERDWNLLFTTKCSVCEFPIEAGDRWVEAVGNAYHSSCFSCTICQRSLEGQNFYVKGGRPYCKAHV